ncbi:MAG: nickel pincer cofactor biosynthesis protein LarB [SAR202 cluster bacterium]|nr:nickel pincer cofactor biosynthesis protein LarB [SAR202 cluster bacterium]|tara:strand:+ start:18901 stop:19653 length:753 start_codon:yes stop_codon:yes gene_type:complete
MDRIKLILDQYKNHEIDYDQVIKKLKLPMYDDLFFAKVDHDRSTRTGFSEVIFGSGKTSFQICKIAESILQKSRRLLITRVDINIYNQIKAIIHDAKFHEEASCITVNRDQLVLSPGITVVSAGTSDMNVVKEIEITSEIMGYQSELILDVGVAGIHRLLSHVDILNQAKVIIVVAGMDGALPSVVCGLVKRPVIAVPTSVGYGANFGGISALLTMLNSCASGIAVVNIDNGYGAADLACRIMNVSAGDD